MPSVFITGAARRMGRGLAIRFARKRRDVIVHYNSSEKEAASLLNELRNFGVNAVKVQADLKDESQVREAFDKAVKLMGVPDILINNAGVFPPRRDFGDIGSELWNHVLDSNLRSVFLVSSEFVKIAGEGSRIINFASLGGQEIWKGRAEYHASKAGVLHLTRAMARDLAPKISVNSVSPGTILFPDDDRGDASNLDPKKIPMKRHGNVDDIFDAVYFFATCSLYITGQNLNVDGGYHYSR
jgi:NAD(P)-dependent dehydrogenase (short-subunit alcohol dehydrogenase family)